MPSIETRLDLALKDAIRATEDERWSMAYLYKAYQDEATQLVAKIKDAAYTHGVDSDALLRIIMEQLPRV